MRKNFWTINRAHFCDVEMSHIPWLDSNQLAFPPLERALKSPNGLLAAGGDLSPERLKVAYSEGIFPWYESGQPILWWSPDPRSVLFPAKLHISRSLRKTLRKNLFNVTADTAFESVINACAKSRKYTHGTWITPEMQRAYTQLFQLGYAHSVEAWQNGELVGGLYGVALGRAFFGESMFSFRTDASKVAFVHLVKQLQIQGYQVIDCQVSSEHLFSLGAEEIPRSQFSQILLDCVDTETEYCKDIDFKITWRYDNE